MVIVPHGFPPSGQITEVLNNPVAEIQARARIPGPGMGGGVGGLRGSWLANDAG